MAEGKLAYRRVRRHGAAPRPLPIVGEVIRPARWPFAEMAKRAPLARARLPIRPLRADRGARGTHNDYGSRANCRAFLPADSVSSPCGLMAGWCGRVTTRETDCVAGVIGLEVRRETGRE